MVKNVVIIGNSGSGKTVFSKHISELLRSDGFQVNYFSDKLGLEEKLLEEVRYSPVQPDGSRIGKHGILVADGLPGKRKVQILDGSLLNGVHEDMIASLAKDDLPVNTVNIIEYATGKELEFGEGKEPWLQSPQNFIERLRSNGILDKQNGLMVIEIKAPLKLREQWHIAKPDAFDLEFYRRSYPDGISLSDEDVSLITNYHCFDNTRDDINEFNVKTHQIYMDFIRQNAIGEGNRLFLPKEGAAALQFMPLSTRK